MWSDPEHTATVNGSFEPFFYFRGLYWLIKTHLNIHIILI